MLYHWHGVAIPVPKLLVPPSARSAQGGTRQQTTARRHRGLLPIGSAQQQAVLPASTSQLHHLQALCGCVSSPPSAEHRSSLSGRGPLTERPSTRISHGRTMPASGSAGPGRWPASHVPTMACSHQDVFEKVLTILIIDDEALSYINLGTHAMTTKYINHNLIFWVWEPFLYGLNTHKLSVRRCPRTHAKGVPDQRCLHRPLRLNQYIGCLT